MGSVTRHGNDLLTSVVDRPVVLYAVVQFSRQSNLAMTMVAEGGENNAQW